MPFRPLLALAPVILLLASLPARAASPEAAVKEFYAFHLSHSMGFTKESVALRARWLTDGLRKECEAWLAAPRSPDEVPSIDGDPFTDTQEYPTAFQAGPARVSGTTARVPVSFTGPGKVKSKVVVVLAGGSGGWRVDDVEEPRGGPSFRKLLADRPAPRP